MVVDIVVLLVIIPIALAALIAKTMAGHLKRDNRDLRGGRATATYRWLLLFQLVSAWI
jgi:hypothetical protein